MTKVTLTFDNGPEPGVTEDVLDQLGRHGVKASFFVIGNKLKAPACRRLAERARAEGHAIGNHTYTHSVPLGRLDDVDAKAEIGMTQDLLGDLAPERLFRPYGGGGLLGPHLLSPAARDYLSAGGFTCVLWNVVPHDWDDPEGWVETAIAMCTQRWHSLVVLHDLPTGAMRRLPLFLDRLTQTGPEIVRDFPSDCLPIVNGAVMAGCERYVTPVAV